MADDQYSDDNDSTSGVTTQELQARVTRGLIAEGVHSMIIARVEKFDPATCKANVQQMIKDFHRDETGALVVSSVPIINAVPVQFLTAGGFTFTVPIVEGETLGSLWFAERSLDRWLAGQGQEVDPQIFSRFNITDAIFMPGVLPFGAPMSVPPPTDHATAGSITGARIHFRSGTICVGDESGSDFLARAQKVLDELNKAHTAFASHTHVVTATVAAANGVIPAPVTSAPTTTTYTPASVATDQAKGH